MIKKIVKILKSYKKIQPIITGKGNHSFYFLTQIKNVCPNNKTENKDITVIYCKKARDQSIQSLVS